MEGNPYKAPAAKDAGARKPSRSLTQLRAAFPLLLLLSCGIAAVVLGILLPLINSMLLP